MGVEEKEVVVEQPSLEAPMVEVMPTGNSDEGEVRSVIGRDLTMDERMKMHRVMRRSYKDMLKSALIKSYIARGKHLIDHAVEVAYEDNTVLIALMKKLVPDKGDVSVEHNLSQGARDEIVSRVKILLDAKAKALSVPAVKEGAVGQP